MMKKLICICALVCLVPVWGLAADPTIRGDYVEVRTADVYTGPCFANGEVNLVGKEAIMAWHVSKGSWEGVPVDGLSVVAVLKANATLGDPHVDPRPTRSVLIVDERADSSQRDALVAFAREMGGDWLSHVVSVTTEKIDLDIVRGHGHHGAGGMAHLRAGQAVELKTRSLHDGDHFCGNEIVYYPPLIDVEAEPAYTMVHRFEGEGLGASWSNPFKRSAFIGHFAR